MIIKNSSHDKKRDTNSLKNKIYNIYPYIIYFLDFDIFLILYHKNNFYRYALIKHAVKARFFYDARTDILMHDTHIYSQEKFNKYISRHPKKNC